MGMILTMSWSKSVSENRMFELQHFEVPLPSCLSSYSNVYSSVKQGSQLDSRQSSPTSQQNVTSSMIYAESATSEVPSVEADFCRTYLGDEESIRASVIPASMAGSHYEPTSRQFLYSPTITECANEEQMETKTEMRKKISMLGPKLVSPKRTTRELKSN